MRWVRVTAHFPTYAAGGPPPSFRITSDADGVATMEIAKLPTYLVAPVCDAQDPWTQFSSSLGSDDQSVAGTTIQIKNGFADYVLPAKVWKNMAPDQERLYYRARASTQASGADTYVSHTDTEVNAGDSAYINVLKMSADPAALTPSVSQDVRDKLGVFEVLWLSVFELLAQSGTDDGKAYKRVLAHDLFTGRSADEQAKILQLFIYCGANGRAIFDRFLDMRIATGSSAGGGFTTVPALFYKDERGEGTLLDHLLALWSIPLHKRIRISQSDVVYDVMYELTDPGNQLNQGYAGTCAATCAQIYTTWRNPAEVARWARYLLDSTKMRVQLANGDYMRINSRAFSRATWLNLPTAHQTAANIQLFTRTYSERAIQAALMDYGNFRATYDPEKDNYRTWLGTVLATGLYDFEMTRMAEAIFNQGWKWNYGGAGANTDSPNRSQVTTDLLSELSGDSVPVFMALRWGTGYHAVVGLRTENNRIVFRNPQYRGGYPPSGQTDGTNLTNPTRQIHKINRAEESMDQAGLNADLEGYMAESVGSERGYRREEIPGHLQATVTPTKT